MPPVYTLNATAVPAIQTPSAYLDPASSTPTVAETITAGETTTGLDKLNQNACRIDALGQLGAGVYGVQQGTGEITAGSGLTANISALSVLIDSAVYAAAQTYACTDSAENYLWANQNGAVVRSGDTTVPSGGKVYLGRVTCSGGAITAIDYSGRQELRGGTLYRKTADTGAPGDTPPSSVSFQHETAAGLYLWTGTAYRPAGADGAVTTAKLADDAVTAAKLADHASVDANRAVTTDHIRDSAVTTAKLAASVQDAIGAAPTVTVGAEAANAIVATVQAKDSAGNSLAERREVRVILCDTQYGAEAASAPDGGVTIGTGTLRQTITTGKQWVLLTNTSGVATLTLTHSGVGTYYVEASDSGRVGSVAATFA